MPNLRLRIEYDGSGFAGFQRQTGRSDRTIQGELEGVISGLLDEPILITPAGRTDTGVHATGQVISFKTSSPMPPGAILRALNLMLHGAIVIRSIEVAEEDFNARHSAISRTYQYLILNAPWPPSVLRGYVMHVWRPLNVEAMQAAAGVLLGTHDFIAFSAQSGHLHKTRRTMKRLEVGRVPPTPGLPAVATPLVDGRLIRLDLEANGFLPHMVRMIVGTLVRVGSGELDEADVRRLLEGRIMGSAGPPAPPQGLTLTDVGYPQ